MPNDNCIVILLTGRIDSSNVQDVEAKILKQLNGNEDKEMVFDASGLDYISSAGLRMLMRFRKRFSNTMTVEDVSPEVYDIFETTGFTELLTVRKRRRTVDVTGCEVIGRGFYGTVYRLAQDTIIKVYDTGDSLPMIENEKRMAKLAFLKGIPTAISYDIVKVSDSYGSVFELLNARTFNDLIIAGPDRADDIIKQYVDFIKLVHKTVVLPHELPSARDSYLKQTDAIREYIGEKRYEGLKALIERSDDENGVVHGDFQMKNVMLVDDEPMLIDMDTLSRGNPVFDLAGLFVTYRMFPEDEYDNPMKFLGIDNDMAEHIWDSILRYYFDTDDADKLKVFENRIRLVAAVRFMYILVISDLKNNELAPVRFKHTNEHIDELLEKVDDISCSAG
jgi:uncharacterized protein (TIGR02172 family)